MQGPTPGVHLVWMDKMGQFSEEEMEEKEEEQKQEERYAEYEAAVYAVKQEERAGQNAGGEPSRLGPREEMEVDQREEGLVELLLAEIATGGAKTRRGKLLLQKRTLRNDLVQSSPAEWIF